MTPPNSMFEIGELVFRVIGSKDFQAFMDEKSVLLFGYFEDADIWSSILDSCIQNGRTEIFLILLNNIYKHVFECRTNRFTNFLRNYINSASDVIMADLNMSVCTGITGNPGMSRIGGDEGFGESYIFGKIDLILMANKAFWWECRGFLNIFGYPNYIELEREFGSFDFNSEPKKPFNVEIDYKTLMPDIMEKIVPLEFKEEKEIWDGK